MTNSAQRFCLSICVVLSCCLSTGCTFRTPVPIGVIPEQRTLSLADEEYGRDVLDTMTQQFPLDRDDGRINRVRDIVDRLAAAGKAAQNPWHAYVFLDDKFKNAAATRGNFIFVWTGILNSTQSDSELSGIIAHEMGHVLAGHTAPNPTEEASEIFAGLAGSVANTAIYSAGGQYGMLAGLGEMIVKSAVSAMIINPEQQRKELEADQIGLFLMADAGYNPDELINFWERVQSDPSFSGFPIQFLSSHPSSEKRVSQLREILPEALRRYETAQLRTSSQRKRRR